MNVLFHPHRRGNDEFNFEIKIKDDITFYLFFWGRGKKDFKK